MKDPKSNVQFLDETSYTIRFTLRKPGSIWSNVNIQRVKRLTAAGRMQPPGLDGATRTATYSVVAKRGAKVISEHSARVAL